MAPRERILVLGSRGMLGSMVYSYFRSRGEGQVTGTVREHGSSGKHERWFEVAAFAREPEKFLWLKEHDWIVNCVGVLKADCAGERDRERAILVNALFPHLLASFLKETPVRVIQIATDGVFSGERGGYHENDGHDAEDLYGRTKSLGEVPGRAVLHLRCSIIGPDRDRRRGLLEWLLGHPAGAVVPGFVHHRWNGVTTLQFAELCHRIVSQGSLFEELIAASRIHHFVPNETVTKYQLLETLDRLYRTNLRIQAVSEPGPPVDRSLSSRFDLLRECYGTSSLESALDRLRTFSVAPLANR